MTEADLLRGILLDPASDAPRLVYADYLEEYGASEDRLRAEFIRAQIRLAQPPSSDCGGYYCDPSIGHVDCYQPDIFRIRNMIDNEDPSWLIPDWTRTSSCCWGWTTDEKSVFVECGTSGPNDAYPITITWRRGFIEAIDTTMGYLLTSARFAFPTQPITSVTITDYMPHVVDRVGPSIRQRYFGWSEQTDSYPSRSCDLPSSIYVRLTGYEWHANLRCYHTPARAYEALSEACLSFGVYCRLQLWE